MFFLCFFFCLFVFKVNMGKVKYFLYLVRLAVIPPQHSASPCLRLLSGPSFSSVLKPAYYYHTNLQVRKTTAQPLAQISHYKAITMRTGHRAQQFPSGICWSQPPCATALGTGRTASSASGVVLTMGTSQESWVLHSHHNHHPM